MAAGVILDRDGVSPSEVVLPLCLCACGSMMMQCSGIDSSTGSRLETGAGDMRQRHRQPWRVQRQTGRCRRLGCGMGGAGPRSGACNRWRRRRRLRCGAIQWGTSTWSCSRRHGWQLAVGGTWLVLAVLVLLLRCWDWRCRVRMRHPRLLNPLHLHGFAILAVCFSCPGLARACLMDRELEMPAGVGWAGLGWAPRPWTYRAGPDALVVGSVSRRSEREQQTREGGSAE